VANFGSYNKTYGSLHRMNALIRAGIASLPFWVKVIRG
jgi:hypothetical protein